MKQDQSFIWTWMSTTSEPEQKDEEQLRENRKTRHRTGWFQGCPCCCSTPVLIGALIGLLVGGAALATILTLYLRKPDSVIAGTFAMSTTTTMTTGTSTTATTSTSSTTTSSTSSTSTTSTTSTTTSTTTTALNVNVVTNGDAESGPCETGGGVTPPTGWNYNGTISQVDYSNYKYGDQMTSDPGPSNRGQCYFFGQNSTVTAMWQNINLTNFVGPLLIDSLTVKFNLSAWMGGFEEQDDYVIITTTFTDQANQTVGNSTSIGPVNAAVRGNITSLLFRQTNGFVPVGARFLRLIVTLFRFAGTLNNGNVDNIAIILYQ